MHSGRLPQESARTIPKIFENEQTKGFQPVHLVNKIT